MNRDDTHLCDVRDRQTATLDQVPTVCELYEELSHIVDVHFTEGAGGWGVHEGQQGGQERLFHYFLVRSVDQTIYVSHP